MTELNDNSELHSYSSAVLYSLSAATPPANYVTPILENFVAAIKGSTVCRVCRILIIFDAYLVVLASSLVRAARISSFLLSEPIARSF